MRGRRCWCNLSGLSTKVTSGKGNPAEFVQRSSGQSVLLGAQVVPVSTGIKAVPECRRHRSLPLDYSQRPPKSSRSFVTAVNAGFVLGEFTALWQSSSLSLFRVLGQNVCIRPRGSAGKFDGRRSKVHGPLLFMVCSEWLQLPKGRTL